MCQNSINISDSTVAPLWLKGGGSYFPKPNAYNNTFKYLQSNKSKKGIILRVMSEE